MVFIAPALPLPPATPRREAMREFDERRDEHVGWGKWNRHYWVEHYEDFLEFFFSQCFTEPHSTKQREDAVGWGLETDAETLVATQLAPRLQDEESVRALLARIDCPMLVIHGSDDAIRPCASGARLAELAERCAHDPRGLGPSSRTPATRSRSTCSCATSSRRRRRRAAGCAAGRAASAPSTSPRRSGSATRSATRRSRTSCASCIPTSRSTGSRQHPVTAVLEARGERIHPASAFLANESHHIESESAEHDLHCFQAIRRMDEILLSNFMVFHDLVREEQYDLWIGDEAWELDYYLHENPEQKRAPYVWLTDFVGWLPMPDGGDHEAFLTGDYNEEMIEHIARFPRVRDRAVFVGNPDDIVPERFASHLPGIREWTEEHYSLRRLRHGLRSRRVRRPRRAPGRARLPRATSRSASSPSAARASAATSCGA